MQLTRNYFANLGHRHTEAYRLNFTAFIFFSFLSSMPALAVAGGIEKYGKNTRG